MKSIFKDRTLIITGIGRSGSTILSKLVGSMKPAFILFEPALMKFIASFQSSSIFTRILFEDYFLNLVHGRGNMNFSDWSCMMNYETIEEIFERQNKLRRRSDAIRYINLMKPWWVIKSLEFAHLMALAHAHFENVNYIHIVRDGLQVVRSSLERGWYTDEFCNTDIVEQTYWDERVRIPYFIEDPQDRIYWPDWNPATRCACAWRNLILQANRYKARNKGSCLQFRYEDFIKTPKRYADYIGKNYNLTSTPLTLKHIDDISNFDISYQKPVDIEFIEEPEKAKFLSLNRRLGY